MVRATVDTAPWLDVLDRRGCVAEMDLMLSWHDAGRIRLFASSRLFDPDTDAMHTPQRGPLRSLLQEHGIDVVGAPFRLGMSRLGGPDLLGGTATTRSPDELRRFIQVVGPDPSTLSAPAVGKAFGRKAADYDALHTHFGGGNDVFVTLDTKDYLHVTKRGAYSARLNLVIMSPAEFVAAYEPKLAAP
jgi:hypothetical protein